MILILYIQAYRPQYSSPLHRSCT